MPAVDLRTLYADQVDAHELQCVILAHFGNSHNYDDRSVFFRTGSALRLTVGYSKVGDIHNISTTDDFPKIELEELSARIRKELVDTQNIKVARIVAFCAEPVRGTHHGESFQISPLLEQLPQPGVGFADQPFLLEVKFYGSINSLIDLSRQKKQATLLVRRLNLLLNPRIHLGEHLPLGAWVQDTHEDEPSVTKWSQLGYGSDNIPPSNTDFLTLAKATVLPRRDWREYYSNPSR